MSGFKGSAGREIRAMQHRAGWPATCRRTGIRARVGASIGAVSAGLLQAAFLLLVPTAALAGGWSADPGASEIAFIYERGGNPADGAFTRFSGSGRFDPADPTAAELTLIIDTGSIELGNALESAFATSVEWFDSTSHPDAVYRLLTLQPTGPGTYEALGTLTIKGREKSLVTEIALAEVPAPGGGPTRVMAQGSLEVDRRFFGLGTGHLSALVTIGDAVQVDFMLVATPGAAMASKSAKARGHDAEK
ncbi:MAG: YceI family protein [Pseudomonadota bacterium]